MFSVLFIYKKFRKMAEGQNRRMHVQDVLEQLFAQMKVHSASFSC
jgi:hypothetical protein